MSRPGDWNCRSCNHLNFQRRDSCHRCGDPRSGVSVGADFGAFRAPFGGGGGYSSGPDVRPGDWYCPVGNCGAHNFASRSSCFKCGAYKEEIPCGGGGAFDGDFSGGARRMFGGFGFGNGGGGGGGGASGRSTGWKSGDWICTRAGCNEHNFASRMECFRCSAPRDTSNNPTY